MITYQPYLGKTIIFCLPGSTYSGNFLVSFTELILTCKKLGMNTIISQDYSSMVNYARCKVLGADVSRGKNQVPFGGRVNYDYLMWIDSDIRFTIESFMSFISFSPSQTAFNLFS